MTIRISSSSDFFKILEIINLAAQKYKNKIPDDCWHEPYMSEDELKNEIDAGVNFSVFEENSEIIGVMGLQEKLDVILIRHAYVMPQAQGNGIGGFLIKEILQSAKSPILIGTWRDAVWAIDFYHKYGFETCDDEIAQDLLQKYWNISQKQSLASVVLAQKRNDL